MSTLGEIKRLQITRKILADAETLKMSGVTSWRRLPLTIYDNDMEYSRNNVIDHGAGVYTIAAGCKAGFTFETPAPNDNTLTSTDFGHQLCLVAIPIGVEHIGRVDVDDIGESDDFYVLTEDLDQDGEISYDTDFYLRYTSGKIDVMTDSSNMDGKLFLAMYCVSPTNHMDDNGDWTDAPLNPPYVDGTEHLDELAVSLYKYQRPSNIPDTSDADLQAEEMVINKTAYAGGVKIVGTMPIYDKLSIFVSEGDEITVNSQMFGYNSAPGGYYKQCTVHKTSDLTDHIALYRAYENLLAEL